MTKPLMLFDFDGVIANSLHAYDSALGDVLREMGYDFLQSRTDYLELFRENFYISLLDRGLRLEDSEKVFDSLSKRINYHDIKIFDDAAKSIELISQMANVAIISSNKESQILDILKANDISHLFATVLGCDAAISKVKKIDMATAKFSTPKSNTYYVADTEGDLKEAKSANVKSIAVGWGWHSVDELRSIGFDYLVNTFDELVELTRIFIRSPEEKR